MNDWREKLEYSLAAQQQFDFRILKDFIPNCVSVQKTDLAQDKRGVDYIATLEKGAEILIDAKTRTADCAKYWKNDEPELALEIWSVCETKIGWALSSSTNVDYILYTFDRSVCDRDYFLPFQLLRKAFRENGRSWIDRYGAKYQYSNTWKSQAVFVPASVVVGAVSRCMEGKALPPWPKWA